jgi:serine protein kinase
MAKKQSLLQEMEQSLAKEIAPKWQGTLADYISILEASPSIEMSAHKRTLRMIESHGVKKDSDGNIISYDFFDGEIFGVEESIDELMSYLRAAATGSEVSRRILLMYGPTSSGKSQIAINLKKGLEAFSKTDEGAIYRIKGSPMHENPLSAIPHEMRKVFSDKLGIQISGELSPYMSVILKEEYAGNYLNLPVERYFFSERDRASIGTFVPSDKKTQDISELIGSLDLSTIAKYGSESDPRAYRFDGELMISNRGMMEFIEMLKVDQKFLYVLLTLAQEKNIKTGRFPLIYADEFILAHTNENEFRKFLAKDEMEALHDRTIVVKVPYNLSVSNEVKIYEKLIKQADFGSVHIAPHTLKCAAMLAVLSRLKESDNKGLTLFNKMKMYDGDEIEGFSKAELSKFKKENDDEGMAGLSPRYVINRISAKLSEDNTTTITPLDILRSLRDGLKTNPKVDKKESERIYGLLVSVIEEYEKLARNDVQKAFFVNFEDEIVNLLKNYMDHIEAYLDGVKIEDSWGDLNEPDERLMRSVEEKIQVTESGKKSFRQEIYRKMLKSNMNYKDHPKLKEALEKELFSAKQDVIRITTSSRNPDPEELKKINVVVQTLCDKHGYNPDSANELLKYVSSLMARK